MRLLRLSAVALAGPTGLAGCSSAPGEPHDPQLANKIDGLCPEYLSEMIADGLPAADSGTTDRANVEASSPCGDPISRRDVNTSAAV